MSAKVSNEPPRMDDRSLLVFQTLPENIQKDILDYLEQNEDLVISAPGELFEAWRDYHGLGR